MKSTELIGHLPSKIAWLCNPGNVATESNQAALMQSAKQMNIKVERFEAREAACFERRTSTIAIPIRTLHNTTSPAEPEHEGAWCWRRRPKRGVSWPG